MRKDSPHTATHLHYHDGSTCHGFPTAQQCLDDAVVRCHQGKVLEMTDTLEDGTTARCYSLIVSNFAHWQKRGTFVAETKIACLKIGMVTPEPQTLYVVYLGGKLASGRMGEDHEVVVVVAADIPAARKAAKAKWSGAGDPHVDAVLPIDVVDGHQISLTPTVREESAQVDDTWVP